MRGVADGVQGDERKQEVARGKQEVAEAASAPATHLFVLLAEEEDDKGGSGGGLGRAGPVGGAR